MAFYVAHLVFLIKSGELPPSQFFDDGVGFEWSADFMATDGDPNFGSKDSRIVIVEFADFTCPACQQAHSVVNEIRKDYGDKVFFVFRDFPVVSNTSASLLAAMAGECAHEQGRFWQMHDKIFANQQLINENQLTIYALQIGLNGEQFSNCLKNGKYLEEIRTDLNDAYLAEVKATPTFFINGKKIEGAMPLANFEKIITYQQSLDEKK